MTKDELRTFVENKQNYYRERAKQIALASEDVSDINQILDSIMNNLETCQDDCINNYVEDAVKKLCNGNGNGEILPFEIYEEDFDKIIEKLYEINDQIAPVTTIGE